MESSQAPTPALPLTNLGVTTIAPGQVWVNLTANQQELLLETILMICREILASTLSVESEGKHE